MAPCGWNVVSCGCGTGCWSGYDPAVRERAESVAALIMYAATGRRYGPCPITVQPVGQCAPIPLYRTYTVPGGGLATPYISGGNWYNGPYLGDGDGAGGACCTRNGCEVWLDGPVTKSQITNITLGGETLEPAAYTVLDGTALVRTDGACWPCCANTPGQATFTVTYSVGLPIPAAVQAAFERLACETAKACGGGDCALPQRIARLSRQGVDIEIEQVPVDEAGLVLTGIQSVDDVIRAVNPHRLTHAPAVLSLDVPSPRRVT